MVNKVILVGNVGNDPEVKTTTNGNYLTKFSLATSKSGYTMKNGTEVPEKTTWHNITIWGEYGRKLAPHMGKGTRLYLEGEIDNTPYEKDGVKMIYSSVVASNISLLGTKSTTSSVTPDARPASVANINTPQHVDISTDNGDDDLPF